MLGVLSGLASKVVGANAGVAAMGLTLQQIKNIGTALLELNPERRKV
jgi:hypothetical protein